MMINTLIAVIILGIVLILALLVALMRKRREVKQLKQGIDRMMGLTFRIFEENE